VTSFHPIYNQSIYEATNGQWAVKIALADNQTVYTRNNLYGRQ